MRSLRVQLKSLFLIDAGSLALFMKQRQFCHRSYLTGFHCILKPFKDVMYVVFDSMTLKAAESIKVVL